MKKTLSVAIINIIIFQIVAQILITAAQEVPVAPSAPTAPTAPTQPTTPTAPTSPDQPQQPSAPEEPEAPKKERKPREQKEQNQQEQQSESTSENQTTENVPAPTSTTAPTNTNTANNEKTGADSSNNAQSSTDTNTDINTNNDAQINNDLILFNGTGSNIASKNSGDAQIKSGDSNIIGSVENMANQTQTSVSSPCVTDCATGNSNASNTTTGSDSQNNSQTAQNTQTLIENNQKANLDTGIIAIADTGKNTAEKNTGNAVIESGDANVGLTVVNVANTDISGVKTSEFDLYDDHRGDIVIDFAQIAAQPSGASQSQDAANNNTGAESANNATTNSNSALTIINNQDADIVSDLAIDATTGHNIADKNSGDADIKTGDANVVANVVNLVNNSITNGAEVLVATVNLFGDLVGDIILTDSSDPTLSNCGTTCIADASSSNQKTGADSQNGSLTTSNSNTTVNSNNSADIVNGMNVNASTGGNDTSKNTGNSENTTGEINVQASETTVANTNTQGGNWWLVVVNEAGEWVGHIFGSEDGQTVASGGTVNLGSVNDTTGAGSNNNAQNNSNNTTNIIQNNDANLDTNININADTGNNSASENTGNGSIQTGDVNIASNIVNFVNNNFVGGKVLITFVNVFGDWTGSVVPPTEEAPQNNDSDSASVNNNNQNPAVGGTASVTTTSQPASTPQNTNTSTAITATPAENTQFVSSNENIQYAAKSSSTRVRRTTSPVSKTSIKATPRKTGKVLGASSKFSKATLERIAKKQWLVEEDAIISVTPTPKVTASNQVVTTSWTQIFSQWKNSFKNIFDWS